MMNVAGSIDSIDHPVAESHFEPVPRDPPRDPARRVGGQFFRNGAGTLAG
jgi:hypothetical protein